MVIESKRIFGRTPRWIILVAAALLAIRAITLFGAAHEGMRNTLYAISLSLLVASLPCKTARSQNIQGKAAVFTIPVVLTVFVLLGWR